MSVSAFRGDSNKLWLFLPQRKRLEFREVDGLAQSHLLEPTQPGSGAKPVGVPRPVFSPLLECLFLRIKQPGHLIDTLELENKELPNNRNSLHNQIV